MKRILGAVLAVGMAGVAFGQDKPAAKDDLTFRVYWKDGLRMSTVDETVKLSIGGRLLYDVGWISEDRDVKAVIGDQEDGTNVRAAWIYTKGDLYDRYFFHVEYGLQDGDADLMFAYIGVKDIPYVGNLKLGHYKEFGLETLTSNKFTTFTARSLPVAFNPGFNLGLSAYDAVLEKRMTYSAGVYKHTNSYGEANSEGEWALTARVTGLPWYEEDGEQLVHVGLNASVRSPVENETQYRTRPEMSIADYYVDTGVMDSERAFIVGPELAVVYGPASVQAEYVHARVKSEALDDPTFNGFYVYGSYFVTGEHRVYKQSSATFGRVRPHENFLGDEDGWGALELAVRYSWIDLDDGLVLGGELADVTGGLTWYLNPNMKIMVNYVHADLDGVGKTNGLMTRFQVDY